ncbi:LCP family protein [Brevibacterium aurantiacum]|uniref:LytR family transcriptional regulator n=1 Tax=Brevibacterium aurantiacum TaxID=273384 RepID=A0A4Z0KMM5_BREAU|nr:LCP family protein [Brevibacterium aurantiacum]TGD38821.1 LytR family transcriptional regulator [Brevibacterium aurantiacum]
MQYRETGPSSEIGPRRQRRLAMKYRRRRTVVAILAVLVIAVPVTVVSLVHGLKSNITSSPLRAGGGEVPEKITDELNVLILGSDTRELDADDYGSGDGARSDAMILAHISDDSSRIDAIQIPRDTMMDMPACQDTGSGASEPRRAMINSALNQGPACSVSAAEELTGVRVDHFIEVNFDGFATVVDLDEPLYDDKANLDLPAGEQTLGGTDALALARTRHAVGDGSDISRMDNQQMVMDSIIDRAKSSHTLSRPDRLYNFLDAVTSSLRVDDDLDSVSALASLASTVSSVPKDSISFNIMPWQPAPDNQNRVVKSPAADAVFSAITADEPIGDLVD